MGREARVLKDRKIKLTEELRYTDAKGIIEAAEMVDRMNKLGLIVAAQDVKKLILPNEDGYSIRRIADGD